MTDLIYARSVRATDANNAPVPGAELRFFQTGTSTPVTVHTDASATTAHSYPILADSSGYFPPVYYTGAVALRAEVVHPTTGAALPGYPIDPVLRAATETGAASAVSFSPTPAIAETNVQEAIEALQALVGVPTAEARAFLLATTKTAQRTHLELGGAAQLDVSGILPPGMIAPFARGSIPSGWLECNGAAVSRTTYSALFGVLGGTYGAGDGSTTFNLPDLRGSFPRGWDNGRGLDSGRVFGSTQTADNYRPTLITSSTRSALYSNVTIPQAGVADPMDTGGAESLGASNRTMTFTMGGARTRPDNVAVYYLIKT